MIPVQANTGKKIHLFLPFGDYADIGHSNRPSKLAKHSLVMYNPYPKTFYAIEAERFDANSDLPFSGLRGGPVLHLQDVRSTRFVYNRCPHIAFS
jgi:hypothetical protein